MSSTVIQVVREILGFLAVLMAAGVVLAGCSNSSDDAVTDGSTPVSTAATTVGNPWYLPLEQRPALFDPCSEIPEVALAEAGFTPEQLDPEFTTHEPEQQMACRWVNDEIAMLVIASWKTLTETVSDPSLTPAGEVQVGSRNGLKMHDIGDAKTPESVRTFFYTVSGAITISLRNRTAMKEFRGKRFVEIDTVYKATAPAIVRIFPEGVRW